MNNARRCTVLFAPDSVRPSRNSLRFGYLDPELSQVMIEVEVGMAHALGLEHLPEHGVRSEFALPSTETLKQDAELL